MTSPLQGAEFAANEAHLVATHRECACLAFQRERDGSIQIGMSGMFLSYCTDVADFVAKISHRLNRMAGLDCYFHRDDRAPGDFTINIERELRTRERFVLFVSPGTSGSSYQRDELQMWLKRRGELGLEKLLFVYLNGAELPTSLLEGSILDPERWKLIEYLKVAIGSDAESDTNAYLCAISVLKAYEGRAFQEMERSFDDLPRNLSVSYEKDLTARYIEGKGVLPSQFVEQGYPSKWPDVTKWPDMDQWQALGKRPEDARRYISNPVSEKQVGSYRKKGIRVDARIDLADPTLDLPTFPEAGPRQSIISPGSELKVGVLVSGGIAPGINAVIAAIVERHKIYEETMNREAAKKGGRQHKLSVEGYLEGFRPLCRDMQAKQTRKLELDDVKRKVRRGGSLIPTARADELLARDPIKRSNLLSEIVHRLHRENIHILYIIGGEGSMRAAHAISTVHQKKYPSTPLSVIGIPKTMDNDILWVWQSFGFLSAVEQARQSINQLATEAMSNPRLCVIQLFGSVSGFVVSHAALGSDTCDLALIPEMEFSMEDVCKYMKECLHTRQKNLDRPYGVVVMAETAIPTDFERYKDKDYVGLTADEKKALADFKVEGHQFVGQTPGALRTAALKIVSRTLQHYIYNAMGLGDAAALEKDGSSNAPPEPGDWHDRYWEDFRVFTNEPRHTIRSMEPSVTDVAYGIRLGAMAVDTAMAGYTDCMVSQWLTEYVVVPLKLVVLGRKRMPRDGVFWRTVVSKTGQSRVEALT